jgi:hypothetical protein
MKKQTFESILKLAGRKYKRLGITKYMEQAVIQHLAELGVLHTCCVRGSTQCKGACPAGQGCLSTTIGNCVCSPSFPKHWSEDKE